MTLTAPTTRAALSTALRIAGEHPSAMLACPVCTANIKAQNLERHLRKVHPDIDPEANGEDAPLLWRGVDEGLWRVGLALLVLCMVGITAFLVVSGSSTMSSAESLALGVPALILFMFFGLTLTPWVPAWLTIEGEHLRLSWGFGILSRSAVLEAPITVGVVTVQRMNAVHIKGADYNEHAETVRGGRYLEVGGIRVATKGKGTAFGKHWSDDGVKSGGRRARWQISIGREDMVALEYALAERGLLRARAQND